MPVYLDNAATTPTHKDVREAMQPFYRDTFGNPSSIHQFGQKAHRAMEQARGQVARGIGANVHEIIFTSGGTEADFLALVGVLRATGKRHLVTTQVEHHAVLNTCSWLEEWGYEVTYVKPGSHGQVEVQDILSALRPDTGLVSVMWVNNETGAILPIETLAKELQTRGVFLHSDAVQALPSIPIDVSQLPVSVLSLSGHKIYGPKGIGALYLRDGTPFSPVLRGGQQERGRRAGTENVAAVVGFGAAVELLCTEREVRSRHMVKLNRRFVTLLQEKIPFARVNGMDFRVPGICNVTLLGVQADALVMALDLDGIAVSNGSACHAGSVDASHVLLAMGIPKDEALSSIRISFSSFNTLAEVERAIDRIEFHVHRLRSLLRGVDRTSM